MENLKRYQQAKHTAIIGGIINTLLGLLKIVFGFMTHSQALFADGIHSFADIFADIFVVIATKASSQAPDASHPYGHERIETLFTIILALVLIFAGIYIAYDAVMHIMLPHSRQSANILSFIVIIISIGANEWLYRYTLRIGKKIKSEVVRANAWHHRSDALSSSIVLVGIIGSAFGFYYLDPIAAILVAVLIFKMALEMIWANLHELIDASADDETIKQIIKWAKKVDGVLSIHKLRTRLLGGKVFIDIHIQVDPYISVSEGHFISRYVEIILQKNIDNVKDVVVHIDSEDDSLAVSHVDQCSREKILQHFNERCASLTNFSQIQKINIHYLNNQIDLEIFFTDIKQNSNKEKLQHEYSTALKNFKYINKIFVWI